MLFPLLRMLRFLCHNLGAAENSQIQADYREEAGHTKTKVRTCRSASCRSGEAVCNWLCSWVLLEGSWPGSPLALALGNAIFPPSGCGRGCQDRARRVSNTLPTWDDVEVSRHVDMVRSLFMLTPGCLPPVGPTSFAPWSPNMWKALLNPNTTTPSPAPLSSNQKSLNIPLPATIPQHRLPLSTQSSTNYTLESPQPEGVPHSCSKGGPWPVEFWAHGGESHSCRLQTASCPHQDADLHGLSLFLGARRPS
jgi:hypothetical protein